MTEKPVYQTIEELMEVVRQQGLIPTTIIISPIMLNRLVAECGTEVTMYNGRHPDETREELEERLHPKGGVVIDRIHTSFGDIEILTSRRCPPETLFVGAFE